jgi:hypothetical protein
MNRSPRPRKTSLNLSPSTHQKLNMYALTAGAAGVSVLALASPADARIVYTPAHEVIVGPHGEYGLDLNNDGVVDFRIINATQVTTDTAITDLVVRDAQGNAVAGTYVQELGAFSAHVFKAGSEIGPFLNFRNGNARLATYYSGGGGQSAHGNWVNVTNGYLALEFRIDGRAHYGWARITVKLAHQGYRYAAELTGYAYETQPETPITAGKMSGPEDEEDKPQAQSTAPAPATLGALAMGAPALSIWRREEVLDEMS